MCAEFAPEPAPEPSIFRDLARGQREPLSLLEECFDLIARHSSAVLTCNSLTKSMGPTEKVFVSH